MSDRKRTGAIYAAIRLALRWAGWHVIDTSRVGEGFPDLLAARSTRLVLVTVTDGTKAKRRQRLTVPQLRTREALLAAGVRVVVVTSVDDALKL